MLCVITLTIAYWVHSNVYGLGNIHCIRYHTTVDSFLSTSPPVQSYPHMTSGSVKVPLGITARNSSFIGEEPVSFGINTIGRSATSSLVSQAEQGIITFTNILQGHDTVVLVWCIIQPETDCTREGRKDITVTELLSSKVWLTMAVHVYNNSTSVCKCASTMMPHSSSQLDNTVTCNYTVL